jgi:branched-chain amino acid transport system permease protein
VIGLVLRRTLAGTAILGVPLIILCVIAAAFFPPSDITVVVNFLITIVLVLSFQIFSGNSGVLSFGHVGFMGVGAYVAAIVTIPAVIKATQFPDWPAWLGNLEVPFLAAVAVAAVAAAVIAAVVGLALTRMAAAAMPLATMAMLIIFFVVFDSWSAATRGSMGIYGIPRHTNIWWALGFALLSIAACRAFEEARIGLKLRSSREDSLAAESLGVHVVRLRYISWITSGLLMGAGGALWAQYNLAFSPKAFYFGLTVTLVTMLAVGGMNTVTGGVIGVAVITLVMEVMRRIEGAVGISGLEQIVFALTILFVLYFRPDGLAGLKEIDRHLSGLWGRLPLGHGRSHATSESAQTEPAANSASEQGRG